MGVIIFFFFYAFVEYIIPVGGDFGECGVRVEYGGISACGAVEQS